MKPLDQVDYFKPVKKLADILCQKTQSSDPLFFRILVSYYFVKVASMMRCDIQTMDRGNVPVSMYALNLALSGHGKGHSTNIVEEQVIQEFTQRFREETWPEISTRNLSILAATRAAKKNGDPDVELALVEAEFARLGQLAFSFDSGTTAAVKQMRHKLLMADAGSMNMEIDEIGSNLLGNQEVLTTFLELFDIGKVKQKLIKNTKENERSEEIDGRTPTNMMLFGTPSKLLNGSKVEEEFYSMLDTGYARRCVFGYTKDSHKDTSMTPQQVLDVMMDPVSNGYLKKLSHKLGNLADIHNFDTVLTMDTPVTLLVIEYRLHCEKLAEKMTEFDEMRKAECSHRYFKALKLSGMHAFIDGSAKITEDHFMSAVKLVEDSGKAFSLILKRDMSHVRLVKYIAGIGRDVTHADITEDLPFYKGTANAREDMLTLGISWGYSNNIIIKRLMRDGIDFFRGESLNETDLDNMTVAYSQDIATGYKSEKVSWANMTKLFTAPGYHWINHHLVEPRRNEDNCIPGFDMIVIDVDGGVAIKTAQMLLKNYTYHLYTTKRHTATEERFRMIFPLNFHLKLDAKDFKQFMDNFFEWLPFDVDRQTGQRARKWLSNPTTVISHDGMLMDTLPFIPKTRKAIDRQALVASQSGLNNLERWFFANTEDGNRSNQFIRFGYMLVDMGFGIDEIRDKLMSLNSRLPEKLDEIEILNTILISVSKAIHARDTKKTKP